MLIKIDEVRKANGVGAYQAGLALSLSIADICGMVEYPSIPKVGERFVKWCDNYIDFTDTTWGGDFALFESCNLCGDMLYALRCAFLHSGSDDVLATSHGSKTLHITRFTLVRPSTSLEEYGYRYTSSSTGSTVEFDIEYLCKLICDSAEKYYNNHPDKTLFDSHTCSFK